MFRISNKNLFACWYFLFTFRYFLLLFLGVFEIILYPGFQRPLGNYLLDWVQSIRQNGRVHCGLILDCWVTLNIFVLSIQLINVLLLNLHFSLLRHYNHILYLLSWFPNILDNLLREWPYKTDDILLFCSVFFTHILIKI